METEKLYASSAMRGIAEWLASIGMGEYTQRFAEEAIDLSGLRDLTEEDLKGVGLPLGHRRKMLRAISELGGAVVTESPELAPRDDAQRRQLTVLSCDMVGSTALSARLDPEDMRRVIAAYQTSIGEVIGQYNGVAKYMGDGVLAYFGHPQAHENDAEQAVRAGLALFDTITRLDTNVGAALQVRVGIATGTVVVGDVLSSTHVQDVVGDAPNLAAKLQALARPGTLLICANTRRLTEGYFEYRDLGLLAVKGLVQPIPVWEVVGPSGIESRFEARHQTKLPTLIGREEQIELLLRRWHDAAQGEGRVVVLTGEPGIGKSHIALAFEERLQSEPHTTLRYFCSEHHTNSAFFPFIGQLERAAGFQRSDSATEKLSKLDGLLAQATADRNTWRFWPTFSHCRAAIATDLRSGVRRNARTRPSRHYWLSSMGWRHGSRFSSFSKTSTGSTQPRWSCSPQQWSTYRSFRYCCSSLSDPNSRCLGRAIRTSRRSCLHALADARARHWWSG